jgi:hypothetical protein
MQGNNLVATGRVGDDTKWATDLVGELSDSVEVSVALDLNTNEDEIARGKAGSRATFVDAIAVCVATIFNNKGDDLAGKVHVLAGVLNVFEDGRAGVGQRTDRGGTIGIQSKVKGKLEFTAHGRNAANNVGTIDRTAIPSISGNHGSFDPNEMSATIGASNGDGFVEVAEESLDTDSFVVSTGSRVEADAEECTSVSENAAEGTAGIHDDKTAHANFQKYLLEQQAG